MEKLNTGPIPPKRYHPVMVSLHWLIALIILSEAIMGVGILHFWPNSAVKIAPLTLHMILGITMLVLLLVQLVGHFVFPRPASPQSSTPFLRFLAATTHFFLYLFAILMGLSGILLALNSHVLQLVAGGPVNLPMYFNLFFHASIFAIFGLIVSFHVLAALYHQFVLRDGLFARMGFTRRSRRGRAMGSIGRTAGSL